VPRERIALGYFLVDIVTIVVAFFVVSGIAALVISNLPNMHIAADPSAGASLVRYLVLPLMWYALVEGATSWNGLRGSAYAGLSWAVFWVLLLLAIVRLPTPLREI